MDVLRENRPKLNQDSLLPRLFSVAWTRYFLPSGRIEGGSISDVNRNDPRLSWKLHYDYRGRYWRAMGLFASVGRWLAVKINWMHTVLNSRE